MRLKLAENRKSQYKAWLHRIIVAGLITVAFYLIFVYVKFGTVFRSYEFTIWIELTFTFIYFLALFWVYPKISRFIQAPLLSHLQSIYVGVIEGMTVVLTTLLLITVTKILPLWVSILYLNATYEGMNAQFDIDALRRDIIAHAITGLFFYYFIERERIRRQIRAEHLKYARLQKESFEVQLENLKNQVNPLFLFNSLDTLDTIIQKSPDTAVEYVEKLSYVYRFFLDHKDQLITLEKELELVQAYLFILKGRLKESLKVDLKIEDDALNYQLPPGSLQSLIENVGNTISFSEKNPLLINVYTQDKMPVLQSNFDTDDKSTSTDSTLEKIIDRYRYLTDAKVQIVQTDSSYIVKLPLLKVEEYQDN